MGFLPERAGDRREFFRAVARYGLLGSLAAVSAFAVGLRRPAGARCSSHRLCQGCERFENCELPQALSARGLEPPKAEKNSGTATES